ncbi:Quercetin 2,3-dioxygenase [Thalassoglobus neptunius]|uniref:Quercetin 2,3-dioxygenase n=1 Tax=Thalassoglobus neptunius TaxID=1938619 RepID=A0A5C5X5L8_9PLAN|nr:cupin domain-containing protein [Thalassoglobus neptunius]TWT57505.1 Quercetin 2,3-dioxygenase [Thalassoglobus neptunius]
MNPLPKIVPAGEGQEYEVIGGDLITIKLTGEETAAAFTLLHTIVPPLAGPPRHVHRRESETFHVLQGRFEFEIDGERKTVGPGDVVFAPRNIPHQFRNLESEPGQVMIICEPSGFENFVEEFSRLSPTEIPDLQEMAEIGARYGIEFVPPSLE